MSLWSSQNFVDQGKHLGESCFKGSVNKMKAQCETVIMSCVFSPSLYSLQSTLENNIPLNVADKLRLFL